MFNRFPTFYNRNTHPRQGYRNFSGAVAGKGKGMSLKTYPASQVFAAAVAAQEHNGEYRKYEQRDPETGAVTARPNKELMREFLEQELTPEQLAEQPLLLGRHLHLDVFTHQPPRRIEIGARRGAARGS